MARARMRLEHQRDFTGGLNLKADPFTLAPNETFDLQNVDIDRRGGFGLRRGSKAFITRPTKRIVTATGASRTSNVVTATGLSPVNGDPGGLVPGQSIQVDFADNTYDGTFTVATAVGGASTATWAQTAADDASAGAGTIAEGFGNPDSGYTYVDTSAVRHILAARGGWVKRWDGSAWQDVIITPGGAGRTIFAEMNDVLYLLKPSKVPAFRWTGSGLATTLTTVAGNFNDDLAAPNDGNFPACKTMAVHHEVMWAGNTNEGGTNFNCRVRWSHISRPEDWRTNDFIDIDANDENGVIQALVPFGDRLLVFKEKAVYAIHGYPPAGFTVQNLTKELGAPTQGAVVATENAVFFWDTDKGAWKYDGKRFEWIFEPLYPLIDDNKINMPFSFQVIAEYFNDRLWLSVPMLGAPYAGAFISLVYQDNLDLNKAGTWTLHTKTLFGWWVHRASAGGDLHFIGGAGESGQAGYVMELDVQNLFTDTNALIAAPQTTIFGVPSLSSPQIITAWYTTHFYDDKNPAMKKRWKRPVMVMLAGADQRTIVDVLTDYDPAVVTKSFDIFTTLDGGEAQWDVNNWDQANWAFESVLGADRAIIVRGSPLSNGVAKALRFRNTVSGTDWRIYGLTMKWIPRPIRN